MRTVSLFIVIFAIGLVSTCFGAPVQQPQDWGRMKNEHRQRQEMSQSLDKKVYRIVVINEKTGEAQTFLDFEAPTVKEDRIITHLKDRVKFLFLVDLTTRKSFDRRHYSVAVQEPGKNFVFYPANP